MTEPAPTNSVVWVMVDVETDGPIPGDYSLTSIGAVSVAEPDRDYYSGILQPISERHDPNAVRVNGVSHNEAVIGGRDPRAVMQEFEFWLMTLAIPVGSRLLLVSDNNGFDFMFVAWYFHHFLGRCPFGHTSVNLGSMYKGVVGNVRKNFKHLRRTRHTHHPVDDARGNVEALREIIRVFGVRGVTGVSLPNEPSAT